MDSNDLHNLNDLLEELEGSSVKTSQGSFVKMEDVRRLIEKRTAAKKDTQQNGQQPKTMEEARAAIKRNPDLMKAFSNAPQEPGRAVSASEPQPASRP